MNAGNNCKVYSDQVCVFNIRNNLYFYKPNEKCSIYTHIYKIDACF